MKNNKPRGKTPSLIGSSNGRPKKIIVIKRSECKRCHGSIEVGQDCFGIPSGSFGSPKRYCKTCFDNILIQTQKDLEEIKLL